MNTNNFVRIFNGSYRGMPIVNKVFPVIFNFKLGKSGGFVTVNGMGMFGLDKFRVKVEENDFEYTADGSDVYVSDNDSTPMFKMPEQSTDDIDDVEPTETDEEAISRIATRFAILQDMTIAAIASEIRAMIVTGPPGVGKSFLVEKEIEKTSMFDKLIGRSEQSVIMKGAISPIGLYCLLYKYRSEGSVVVMDDVDSILNDENSLNILKGALDSGKSRRISWISDSHMLRREDVPSTFEFKGSVIFITNIKFDRINSKMGVHLAALQSRCHYLDLTIDTTRDKLLRIRQIADTGELFSDHCLSDSQIEDVLTFIDDNQSKLREISLRQATKIADLVKSFPNKWRVMAAATCMRA